MREPFSGRDVTKTPRAQWRGRGVTNRYDGRIETLRRS
jgi:hypothetical protein